MVMKQSIMGALAYSKPGELQEDGSKGPSIDLTCEPWLPCVWRWGFSRGAEHAPLELSECEARAEQTAERRFDARAMSKTRMAMGVVRGS
jgi:hypothetical protein